MKKLYNWGVFLHNHKFSVDDFFKTFPDEVITIPLQISKNEFINAATIATTKVKDYNLKNPDKPLRQDIVDMGYNYAIRCNIIHSPYIS